VARAEVDWQALISPTDVGMGLNVSRVPITFTASVLAIVGGTEGTARAVATAPFGVIQACMSTFSLPDCTNSDTNVITGLVFLNTPLLFEVTALGGIDQSSAFSARADPLIEITDELVPGTDINFRDAFTLSLSPDVTQSVTGPESAVPEPATDLLCSAGCGLILIVSATRHQHRTR
jgi:hypothetical protein